MKIANALGMISILLGFSACVRTEAPELIQNKPRTTAEDAPSTVEEEQAKPLPKVSIPLTFSQSALQNQMNVATSDLMYGFSYAKVERKGDIVFKNGVAKVLLTALPVGVVSDCIFDMHILRGTIGALELKSGDNSRKLILEKVDGVETLPIEIGGEVPADPGQTVPDQTARTSYQTDILPLLNSCMGCHGDGGSAGRGHRGTPVRVDAELHPTGESPVRRPRPGPPMDAGPRPW